MARNKYDTDEVLEESFDVNQLKRLGKYVKPYMGRMICIIILMLSASALTMTIPLIFLFAVVNIRRHRNGVFRVVL